MKRHPSAKRYRLAFQAMAEDLAPAHRAMLEAHYQAPSHTITLGELAEAAGYNGEEGAKLQYGLLAKRVCEEMSFEPPEKNSDGSPIWSYALADIPDAPTSTHWQWTLRPEVVQALDELAWFNKAGRRIGKVAAALEDEGYFNAKNLKDERKKTLKEVARRQGQPKFRKNLLAAYGGKCAVTGCDANAALEAAHIMPFLGPKTNHVSNGVLLRADIHTLFDLDLIGIDPKSLKVVLSEELRGTCYDELEGRMLALPGNAKAHPSRAALREKWKNFT